MKEGRKDIISNQKKFQIWQLYNIQYVNYTFKIFYNFALLNIELLNQLNFIFQFQFIVRIARITGRISDLKFCGGISSIHWKICRCRSIFCSPPPNTSVFCPSGKLPERFCQCKMPPLQFILPPTLSLTNFGIKTNVYKRKQTIYT